MAKETELTDISLLDQSPSSRTPSVCPSPHYSLKPGKPSGLNSLPWCHPRPCWPSGCPLPAPTRVKLLGEAAQRLTVVSGHSCSTSLVFSSTRITESLVIPSRRGTSLFLPFIFSWNRRYGEMVFFLWICVILPSNQWCCNVLPGVNLQT